MVRCSIDEHFDSYYSFAKNKSYIEGQKSKVELLKPRRSAFHAL